MDRDLLVEDLMESRFEVCESRALLWQVGSEQPRPGRVIPVVSSFQDLELIAELHTDAVLSALSDRGDDAFDLRVLDLCTPPVRCEALDTAESALATMKAAGRSALPVTTSGRLIGTLRFEVAYRFSDPVARETNGSPQPEPPGPPA